MATNNNAREFKAASFEEAVKTMKGQLSPAEKVCLVKERGGKFKVFHAGLVENFRATRGNDNVVVVTGQ